MKTELLNKIADVVSDVCDISVEDIKGSCKCTELVEARTIFIWQCNRHGFCVNDIAKYINRKRSKSVYDYISNYHLYKRSPSFRLLAHEVDRKMSEAFPEV